MAKRKKANLQPYSIEIAEETPYNASLYVQFMNSIEHSFTVVKKKTDRKEIFAAQRTDRQTLSEMKKFEVAKPCEQDFWSLKDDESYMVLFKERKNLMGFAIIQNKAETAYISEFSVNIHLMGYGSKYYRELEKMLLCNGKKIITARAPFDGSREFWTRMGFTINTKDVHPLLGPMLEKRI